MSSRFTGLRLGDAVDDSFLYLVKVDTVDGVDLLLYPMALEGEVLPKNTKQKKKTTGVKSIRYDTSVDFRDVVLQVM